MKFYANNTDLLKVPVTQNEKGVYYSNGKSYYKPVLQEFDNAKPPKGYKRYTDGSHKAYLNERAIDFSIVAGTKIKCDSKIKFNRYFYVKGNKNPYGIELITGNLHIILYHVKASHKPNTRIEAGQTICKVMTTDENRASGVGNLAPHLHAGTVKYLLYENKSFRTLITEKPKEPVEKPNPELEKLKAQIKLLEEQNKKLSDKLIAIGKILNE